MKSKKINLEKGFVEVYDFGNIKLHAYQTGDIMNDEAFILENESNLLLVEFPSFYEDLKQYENYVKGLNKTIIGKVFSDHPSAGTIFTDVDGYASKGTIKSMESGSIYNIIEGFKTAYNGTFASEMHTITDVLEETNVNIGGFDLSITYHDEDIEIVFPQINAVYTHMLGHDTHSIVAGSLHADEIISQLESYKENGYDLIFSSHYTPETLKDVDEKIEYLKNLKEIANTSSNKEEFIEKVNTSYPKYKGLNYLDMTAGYFFQ